VFIARQDITAEQVEALADDFTKVIEGEGGKVASRENWGLRGLAYKIKKNRKGHYVLMNIDAPAGALHEMERQMGLNEDILRHITLRVDEFAAGPSIIMANRGKHEERPRRDKAYENTPGTHPKPAEAAPEVAADPVNKAAPEVAADPVNKAAPEVAADPANKEGDL
jgi:small subunit ribosomal protein S6